MRPVLWHEYSTGAGRMGLKTLKELGQGIGNIIFVVYLAGAMSTGLILAIMVRWECIQDRGLFGVFWCDVLGSVVFPFFKAILWPYLLYQWLSS